MLTHGPISATKLRYEVKAEGRNGGRGRRVRFCRLDWRGASQCPIAGIWRRRIDIVDSGGERGSDRGGGSTGREEDAGPKGQSASREAHARSDQARYRIQESVRAVPGFLQTLGAGSARPRDQQSFEAEIRPERRLRDRDLYRLWQGIRLRIASIEGRLLHRKDHVRGVRVLHRRQVPG